MRWLKDVLEGYGWLWRAQRRWHAKPLWLAAPVFAWRVAADVFAFARSALNWRKPVYSTTNIIRFPSAVAAGLFAAVVAVGGVFTWVSETGEGARSADARIETPPVLINRARVQIDYNAPVLRAYLARDISKFGPTAVYAAVDSMIMDPSREALFERYPSFAANRERPFTVMVPVPGTDESTRVTLLLVPDSVPPHEWPEILNPDEVAEAIMDAYPRSLLDEGKEGVVAIRFLVGPDGDVEKTRIGQVSAYPALDQAALEAAKRFRFSPAVHEGRQVAAWATAPISFRTRPLS